MATPVSVTSVSEEEFSQTTADVGMGHGIIDNAALISHWLIQGEDATIAGAKAALKGGPVGAFVIYTPIGEPVWKLRLLLKAPNKKLHHYTVINSAYGFHLKGSRVSTSNLSDFVTYYCERQSKSLPTRLVIWKRSPVDSHAMPTVGVSSRGLADTVSRPPRRRALLIAISYRDCYLKKGSDLEPMFLNGCLHDTREVYRALSTHWHFRDSEIYTINEGGYGTDAPKPNGGQPTRANIIKGLNWLVEDVQPGDQLFVHIAGHGVNVHDRDEDEADGYDEALVPLDWKRAHRGGDSPERNQAHVITDDEIFKRVVSPLPQGVVAFFVVDTCHSGSLTDLKYSWAGKTDHDRDVIESVSNREHNGGLAVCLSACTDAQEATGLTMPDGTGFGVFTQKFIQSVVVNGCRTYRDIFVSIQQLMRTTLSNEAPERIQSPRISFSSYTRGMLDNEVPLFSAPRNDLSSAQSSADFHSSVAFSSGLYDVEGPLDSSSIAAVDPSAAFSSSDVHEWRRPPRKRALLIAISYLDCFEKDETPMYLNGCLYDTMRVYNALIEDLHFRSDNVRTINEGESVRDPHGNRIAPNANGGQPTRDNIIAGFKWLVDDVQPGDQLFVHIAGHGVRVPDDDGDEADGHDEALVPLDWAKGGNWKTHKLIRDDEIFQLVVKPLPAAAHVHFVVDTCHSGSLTDLKYAWTGTSAAGEDLFEHASSREHDGGLAVCISACTDEQQATGLTMSDGSGYGVLTAAWLKAVVEDHMSDHRSIFTRISEYMKEEFNQLGEDGINRRNQTPRVSFSRKTVLDEEVQHFKPVELLRPVSYSPSATSQNGQGEPNNAYHALARDPPPIHGRAIHSTQPSDFNFDDDDNDHSELFPALGLDDVDPILNELWEPESIHLPTQEPTHDDSDVHLPPIPRLPISGSRGVDDQLSEHHAATPTLSAPPVAGPDYQRLLTDSRFGHLKFLERPGNEVAFDTLVEGLGEGWLTVDDLLHHSQLVSALKLDSDHRGHSQVMATTDTHTSTKTTNWREVSRGVDSDEELDRMQRKREHRQRKEREKRRELKERERQLRREERRFRREQEKHFHAYSNFGMFPGHQLYPTLPLYAPPMHMPAPEVHVHIKNAKQPTPAPPPPPPPPSTTLPPVPYTSTVEEEWFTEEYVVNPDGTEKVIGRHPTAPPTATL